MDAQLKETDNMNNHERKHFREFQQKTNYHLSFPKHTKSNDDNYKKASPIAPLYMAPKSVKLHYCIIP